MTLDPISILMFGLIAVLIFFMFRNGKKRQQAMQELQNGLRPGAEVMLQSGIFGTIESIDENENRATVRSGSSTFVVHRNAISQIVTPVEGADDAVQATASFAPDDDPEFGERLAEQRLRGDGIVVDEQDLTGHAFNLCQRADYFAGGNGGAWPGANSAPMRRNRVSASLR